MTSRDRDSIRIIKDLINTNNLSDLQEYYEQLQSSENTVNWQYIYQSAYIHACLKQRRSIVEWLTSLFEEFDPILKIAMRHLFSYGRHLERRHNPYLKGEREKMNIGHTG